MYKKCEDEEGQQQQCKVWKHKLEPPDEQDDSREHDYDFGSRQEHHIGTNLAENDTLERVHESLRRS